MAETATSRAALLPLSLPMWLDPLAGKEVDRSVVYRGRRKKKERKILVLLLEEKQNFEPKK
jgi:hypothetical protein